QPCRPPRPGTATACAARCVAGARRSGLRHRLASRTVARNIDPAQRGDRCVHCWPSCGGGAGLWRAFFIGRRICGCRRPAAASGALLAVLGGFLFGTLVGGFASMVGSTAGATIVFLVARSTFGDHLLRRAGPLTARFAAGFRADAFCYVLFMRLVPVPAWFTNVIAAVLNVRLRTFVAATALGRTPGSLALALLGAGLDSVIAAQAASYRACLAAGDLDCPIDFDPASVITPMLLAALLALGLLALVPVLARRALARRAA